jgi:hypothetical protein
MAATQSYENSYFSSFRTERKLARCFSSEKMLIAVTSMQASSAYENKVESFR